MVSVRRTVNAFEEALGNTTFTTRKTRADWSAWPLSSRYNLNCRFTGEGGCNRQILFHTTPAFSFSSFFFFHAFKKVPFECYFKGIVIATRIHHWYFYKITNNETISSNLRKMCNPSIGTINRHNRSMSNSYKIGYISISVHLVFNSVDLFLNDWSSLLLNDFIKPSPSIRAWAINNCPVIVFLRDSIG